MSTVLKKLLEERKSDTIQDEIRKRVLARYSELKGLESEKLEFESTLDALEEMTGISRQEIDCIASEVQKRYTEPDRADATLRQLTTTDAPELELFFEQSLRKTESAKQGFIFHLVPYTLVNMTLVILNVITTSFPWSMFPAFFWGIGLISHYLGAVHWPRKGLLRKIALVKNQVHQILNENTPNNSKEHRPQILHGLYRLTITQSDRKNLEEYLSNADPSLTESNIKQISTQIAALQNQYLKNEVT